jgi:hypothetical protein
MKWAVEATEAAEEELAELWLLATDRPAITAAQHAIEQRLQRDPLGQGAELSEGLWKIVAAPLVAYYEVDASTSRVVVTSVTRSP